jgi:hypothetical protein
LLIDAANAVVAASDGFIHAARKDRAMKPFIDSIRITSLRSRKQTEG